MHSVIFGALGVVLFALDLNLGPLRSEAHRILRGVTNQTGQGASQGFIVRELGKFVHVGKGTLTVLAATAVAYCVVEAVEAVGLWMERRWAEYLTAVATAGFLPFEIDALIKRVTVLRVGALAVNVDILLWLLWRKRLFGIRGGPKAEERLKSAGIDTIGDLAALTDEYLRRLLPGTVGAMLRDRARGIDPRELELGTERISISVENTFERDISDRERLHDELRGMASEVAEALRRRGQVARTVTTKLRYADFSIRSRSTSLASGIDEPDTIADLACHLLDRGLRDRPGALRLVGVGVSGLADFRQLSLEAV